MLHSFLCLFIFKMSFYMYDTLNWIVHTSLKPKLPSTIRRVFFPPRKKFGLMRGGKELCSANGSRCIWISFCRWVHVCLWQQCSAHLASGSNIISANALCTRGTEMDFMQIMDSSDWLRFLIHNVTEKPSCCQCWHCQYAYLTKSSFFFLFYINDTGKKKTSFKWTKPKEKSNLCILGYTLSYNDIWRV